MNIMVIYDSQFGNTERLAQSVAAALKTYGKAEARQVRSTQPASLAGTDLLILASPTVAWRELPAMRDFLARLLPGDVRGLRIACFETVMHLPRCIKGSAVSSMRSRLDALGAMAPVSSGSFYVTGRQGPLQQGEEERAVQWARAIVA